MLICILRWATRIRSHNVVTFTFSLKISGPIPLCPPSPVSGSLPCSASSQHLPMVLLKMRLSTPKQNSEKHANKKGRSHVFQPVEFVIKDTLTAVLLQGNQESSLWIGFYTPVESIPHPFKKSSFSAETFGSWSQLTSNRVRLRQQFLLARNLYYETP
jgi:hypothetical protein